MPVRQTACLWGKRCHAARARPKPPSSTLRALACPRAKPPLRLRNASDFFFPRRHCGCRRAACVAERLGCAAFGRGGTPAANSPSRRWQRALSFSIEGIPFCVRNRRRRPLIFGSVLYGQGRHEDHPFQLQRARHTRAVARHHGTFGWRQDHVAQCSLRQRES